MRKITIIISIILISFAIGIYFYHQMPDFMASHWNAKGQVNGYLPKLWGLFLMPFISLFMFLLFLLIPGIDPLKSNIRKFRDYFDGFILLIIAFLFYLYSLTIIWNLGIKFDMVQFLLPSLAIIFYYAGILVENAKRNWFIGIRTPWTMSNDQVWDKTHKIGGKLFKAAGIIALLGIPFPDYAIFFVIIPVLSVAVYTIVYSYLEYQREMKISGKP
jgi:uncharacterized membrane protein